MTEEQKQKDDKLLKDTAEVQNGKREANADECTDQNVAKKQKKSGDV